MRCRRIGEKRGVLQIAARPETALFHDFLFFFGDDFVNFLCDFVGEFLHFGEGFLELVFSDVAVFDG